MKTPRHTLEAFLKERLQPHLYQDYGPNGLQVEGTPVLERVAFAVSATLESISAAVEQQADALVVHHGLFWDFHGARTLTGPFGRRVRPLVAYNVNLFGYHLPLDGHAEIGNAACIAQALQMQARTPFGDHKGMPTGVRGHLLVPLSPLVLQKKLEHLLHHPVLLSTPDPQAAVQTLGIITGGANKGWQEAAAAGLDAYLTGEMSEHDWHEAKEAGIHLFAGGHHATEVFGIQRLMQEVQAHFSLTCFFLDSANPA